MSRLSILTAVGALLAAGSAMAADLPTTKGPAPAPYFPPVFSWAGFYAGVNAGGLFGSNNLKSNPAPQPQFGPLGFSQTTSPDAFIGGAQIGYNFQSGPFVFGGETDFQGSTLSQSSRLNGLPNAAGVIVPGWNDQTSDRMDWFGTVRLRAGYAIDRTLIYATGGLIYGDVKNSSVTTYTVTGNPQHIYTGSSSGTRAGWTLGGGVEYAFTNNWTARLEGLYFDMGKQSYTAFPLAANAPFVVNHSSDLTGGIVRVGLNYKFW
jgi:outer membrane immunogenic protein